MELRGNPKIMLSIFKSNMTTIDVQEEKQPF